MGIAAKSVSSTALAMARSRSTPEEPAIAAAANAAANATAIGSAYQKRRPITEGSCTSRHRVIRLREQDETPRSKDRNATSDGMFPGMLSVDSAVSVSRATLGS